MSDELRSQARTVYFEARRRGAFHLQGLQVVLPMLERQQAKDRAETEHSVHPDDYQETVLPPLPPFEEIETWAAEAAWDQQFQALQSDDFRDNLRSPDDLEDRFRLRLDVAQRQREVAADALRQVQAEMDLPTFALTDLFLQRLSRAQTIYEQACKSEERQEDTARRRLLEIPSGPAAEADIRAREQALLDYYADLPPVYRVLCGQLAELQFRAEHMRASGRDVSTEELVKLNGAVLATIGQMQKYTESTKSESLSKDRNELALALLDTLERVIAPSQPALWAQAFMAVKRRLLDQGPEQGILNTGDRSLLSLVPTGPDAYGREPAKEG